MKKEECNEFIFITKELNLKLTELELLEAEKQNLLKNSEGISDELLEEKMNKSVEKYEKLLKEAECLCAMSKKLNKK